METTPVVLRNICIQYPASIAMCEENLKPLSTKENCSCYQSFLWVPFALVANDDQNNAASFLIAVFTL